MTTATRVDVGRPSWCLFTASARGATHEASSLPNQDAVAYRNETGDEEEMSLVVTVADGHGDRRHFRSAAGARSAVEAGCEAAAAPGLDLARLRTSGEVADRVRMDVLPDVVRRWRVAVTEDLVEAPFSPDEEALRHPNDAAVVAYGSTLLLAIVNDRWCVIAQVGDGDAVVVHSDGKVVSPVPTDPLLDGQHTTSLCQADALDAFRIAVMPTDRCPLVVLLLATDGYGNSQIDDPWQESVVGDIAGFVRERGPSWVGAQLPEWVARCASAVGSGDDTSVALLLNGEADPLFRPGRP